MLMLYFSMCVCVCVFVKVAGLSKKAANVPVCTPDLHTGQRVHLCQPQVFRVTTPQVGSAEQIHFSVKDASAAPILAVYRSFCCATTKYLQL